MMRHFALFAVLPWFGIMAFCQSPATTSGAAQAPIDEPSSQALFNLNISQLGQASPTTRSFNAQSCAASNANQRQARVKIESNQLFHLPCTDSNAFTLMAQVNEPASSLSSSIRHGAKFVPIPTDWPNAKFEQIPTTWPNLKMLRITEPNSGSVPAK